MLLHIGLTNKLTQTYSTPLIIGTTKTLEPLKLIQNCNYLIIK